MDAKQMLSGAAGVGGRIEAVLLKPKARLACLPKHFGPRCVVVEHAVYDMMRRLCQRYRGGYWDYYDLSNGGFFMAPSGDEVYRLECDGNGYAGDFAPRAAGIAVCAMTYSHLSFRLDHARMAEMYYRLRDFIGLQPEARELFALLD